MHSKPEGSTISRYDSLKQVEKSTGRTPPELVSGPQFRQEFEYAWQLFCTMPKHSYTELEAYSRLTGVILSPWEVEAVMVLSRQREAGIQWRPK